jgi:hypothetical protein
MLCIDQIEQLLHMCGHSQSKPHLNVNYSHLLLKIRKLLILILDQGENKTS